MRERSQAVVVVLIVYAVVLILISPAVASPMSTVRSKHTVQPPQLIIPLATLLLTTAFVILNPLCEAVLAPPAHQSASGSDLVALNTARLC
jgi:hypothetical protein